MQSLRLTNLFGTTLPAVYLKQFELAREHHLFMWTPDASLPRFELFIHDTSNKTTLQKPALAVFIVPQTQESQWTFVTADGREQLANALKAARLILIKLGRGQTFRSVYEVQKELAGTIKELKPDNFLGKVSFYCNESPTCRRTLAVDGEVIVEETKDSEGGFRSLSLSSCLHQTQSEVRIAATGFCDFSDIRQDSLKLIISGLALMLPPVPSNVAVLGGGAGVLSQFLTRYFPHMNVFSVERNAILIKVSITQLACEHFSLIDTDRLHVVHSDAADYVSELHHDNKSLTAVVVDINSESVKSPVPPTAFRSFWFVLQVKEIMAATGLLVINAVHRNSNHRIELVNVLKDCFSIIYSARCDCEDQEIFFALKVEGKYIPKVHSQWKQRMRAMETDAMWSPKMKLWKMADRISLEFPLVEVSDTPLEPEIKKKVRKPPSSKRSGL